MSVWFVCCHPLKVGGQSQNRALQMKHKLQNRTPNTNLEHVGVFLFAGMQAEQRHAHAQLQSSPRK